MTTIHTVPGAPGANALADALRAAAAAIRTDDVEIVLQDGTYFMDEALALDSGSFGGPHALVIRAAKGAIPVISGGIELDCDWHDFRDGIKVTSVDPAISSILFRQLFVNNKRQTLARYPSYDVLNPTVWGTGYAPVVAGISQGKENPTGLVYDPERFSAKRWAHPEEAHVNIFTQHYWGNLMWDLAAVDRDRGELTFANGGHQMNTLWAWFATELGPDSKFFVENVFEELTEEGEWYLDRREHKLYYKPPAGLELATAEVVVPRLKQLVEFRGTQAAPVRNVTISGVVFRHAMRTIMDRYDAPSLGDWTIHRGGAVFFEGAEDCRVELSWFDQVGGNALFLNNYNRGITVYANKFNHTGDSAVCLVGNKNRTFGTQIEYPVECIVDNNLMHDLGYFGKQVAAVFLSCTAKNRVTHNRMHHLPRSGITVNDNCWGGHLIEDNDIFITVQETGDHGPFNAWGRERQWVFAHSHKKWAGLPDAEYPDLPAGDHLVDAKYQTVIRHNRFRDTTSLGIDMDDGSANYLIEKNLCIGIGSKMREGNNRIVRNNIFYKPAMTCRHEMCYTDCVDEFYHNIIVARSGAPGLRVGAAAERAPWCTAKQNLIFELDGRTDLFEHQGRGRVELNEWQALGYGEGTLVADPLFEDPANFNFALKPDSPAHDIGFEAFPLEGFGPVLPKGERREYWGFAGECLDDSCDLSSAKGGSVTYGTVGEF